jgi:hypothetical protein
VPTDWSRREVEATVSDYFEMLAAELAGAPYNKTVHRRRLLRALSDRSEQSIEFKRANISAVLIELGFPYIAGYKPRSNYQALLYEVVADRLATNPRLLSAAEADADLRVVVPEVDDILSVLTKPPSTSSQDHATKKRAAVRPFFSVNYLEREARNRSLGTAGEKLVITFERARLIRAGRESLAARIEHTAQLRGDAEGFDIRSFEETGVERLIEVKTTKYGRETPFFVSSNEVSVSESSAGQYYLYRLFAFRSAPKMFILSGALSKTCRLSALAFLATVH